MEENKELDFKQQVCGIYKITNLVNAKVYIGQSVNMPARWTAHKSSAFNPNFKGYENPLYRAIRKYGVDNFDFSVIEYCKAEELNEKEIYWIKYYDSFKNDLKGYNLTPGGHEPIIIIPEELKQKWDEGYTTKELGEYFGVNKDTISKWLERIAPDYNTIESHRRGTLASSDIRIKKINQYDLDGNFLQSWPSLRQIERELGFNKSCISACCKKKYYSSYGFRWGYEDEELISKEDFYSYLQCKKGQKHGNSTIQVNQEDIEYIKKELAKGASQQKIADSLGINRHVITKINTGKHWNDGGTYPIYDRKEKKTNRPELLD